MGNPEDPLKRNTLNTILATTLKLLTIENFWLLLKRAVHKSLHLQLHPGDILINCVYTKYVGMHVQGVRKKLLCFMDCYKHQGVNDEETHSLFAYLRYQT